jgi:alanine racemase
VYTIEVIAQVVKGTFLQKGTSVTIEHLVYDSRSITYPAASLFFALHTQRQDGHQYITEAYQRGVRCFMVSQIVKSELFTDAAIVMVPDTLKALQELAIYHRSRFSIPVIGITGSNGKTVVKEWLYQLLQQDYNIVRSPRSYNSQIGVPLSVWQLNKDHTLAIFEAGISHTNEMQVLAEMIQPAIGILTNIGEAHSENFKSLEEKAAEKLTLFTTANLLVYPGDDDVAAKAVVLKNKQNGILDERDANNFFTWGKSADADLQLTAIHINGNRTRVIAVYNDKSIHFNIPFIDEGSIHNTITCCAVLLYLGYSVDTINERLLYLHAVDMRLQLKHGINNCLIVNDSYSADLTSLHIALHFMAQQGMPKRTVILSDFVETGRTEEVLYQTIASALQQHAVSKVIAIGNIITQHLQLYLPATIELYAYATTEEFIDQFKVASFQNEAILIKGARRFQFERIVNLFETKVHQTRLEINLNAIAHNLKQYQSLLPPATKVMVMVKAFAYGSGSSEIASVLQFNKVDYLGVAYADEGIALRKGGITIPVMVMNADESSFSSITEHNLQPVIYSFDILQTFEQYSKELGLQNYPVHLEIETGMNRLGFPVKEVARLGSYLKDTQTLHIESVFSHLAASEDPAQDAYTQQQAMLFQEAVFLLQQSIAYPFLKHIANSAAIVRHPYLQGDMVRLGIGIYGIEIATEKLDLQPVATLRATIAQLKELVPGESVSYNRRGIVKEPSLIATVRIGYADGYSRRLGNGIGKMWVNGHMVPVIGTVCMDMTMIDVTGVTNVRVGDEVVIFGKELPVQQVAAWAETIPYEIMTGISHRVKRVYFQE